MFATINVSFGFRILALCPVNSLSFLIALRDMTSLNPLFLIEEQSVSIIIFGANKIYFCSYCEKERTGSRRGSNQ